ncbi:MAG: hypothetical protein ACTSRZ_02640 [Promethearchaeota archaeon]
MENIINLDQFCAKYGFEFAINVNKVNDFNAKKTESLITKALGVLQNQGLYAFGLFCVSRPNNEKNGSMKIIEITKCLLNELKLIDNDNDFLNDLRKNLLSNLDKLMLAIQLLEKSLIYARFHAKAMKKD